MGMSVLPCTSHCVASVLGPTEIPVVAMHSVNYSWADTEMKHWCDFNNDYLVCDRPSGKNKCTEW